MIILITILFFIFGVESSCKSLAKGKKEKSAEFETYADQMLYTKIALCVGCVSTILITLFGYILSYNAVTYKFNRDIEIYNNTKTAYEATIDNNAISDVELVEITNAVIKVNKTLAQDKVSVRSWWNAPINENIKYSINQADYISFQ